jgi:1,4-alpha-glucan branching enzyme
LAKVVIINFTLASEHIPARSMVESGINFAVWAPNARSVQVVGDFNGWNGRAHAARVHEHLGIWELFVPQAKVGDKYKYRILSQHGEWMDKCDPLGSPQNYHR